MFGNASTTTQPETADDREPLSQQTKAECTKHISIVLAALNRASEQIPSYSSPEHAEVLMGLLTSQGLQSLREVKMNRLGSSVADTLSSALIWLVSATVANQSYGHLSPKLDILADPEEAIKTLDGKLRLLISKEDDSGYIMGILLRDLCGYPGDESEVPGSSGSQSIDSPAPVLERR